METQTRAIHTFKEGEIFDNRYRLLKRAGSGGFADVWKAEDTLLGQVVVALKLYCRLDDEGIVELAREYTRMSVISHPNLLTGNHFATNGNIPYLEMRYCDGGNLASKVGKMTVDELRHMLCDIASGLTYLHSKGIVHQDIKPENILYDTESDTYLLSDFGISSKSRSRLSKSVNMAQMTLSMTEAYAPPEKFSSNYTDLEPDTKGDIFSLGLTVYELAVGQLPFQYPMATGREMLMQRGQLQLNYCKIEDNSIRKIVELCTSYNKKDRPKAEDLISILNRDEIVYNEDGNNKEEGIATKPTTVKIKVNNGEKQKLIDPKKLEFPKPPKSNSVTNSRRIVFIVTIIILVAAVLSVVLLTHDGPIKNLGMFNSASAEKKQTKQNIQIPNDFVLCPSGILNSYYDGWNGDVKNIIDVPLDSFYISKYELTQAEWKKLFPEDTVFMYYIDPYDERYVDRIDKRKKISNDSLPVARTVSQIIQYCIKRSESEGYKGFYHIEGGKCYFDTNGNGYRLPNEYEWVYAARGCGREKKYSAGDNLNEIAWYGGNSKHRPHPVGQKKPNELDIYDMCGNVSEICWPSKIRWKKYPVLIMDNDYLWYQGFEEYGYICTLIDACYAGTRLVFVPEEMKNRNISILEIPCEIK